MFITNIYRYVFIAAWFVLLTIPRAYSSIPGAYISLLYIQDNICDTVIGIDLPCIYDNDISDNDVSYIRDNKVDSGTKNMIGISELMMRVCPYFYENYRRLAFIYDYIGDYNDELEVLKSMIVHMPEGDTKIEGRDIDYGNLGRAYFITGDVNKAKYWLDKADEINPDNMINRRNYLLCCISERNFEKAAKELNEINKFSSVDTISDRGDLYFDTWQYCVRNIKDRKQIVKLFQAAVDENPYSFRAHRALGIAIRGLSASGYEKRMPAALKEFDKALKINPKYIPTYVSIADTYLLLAVMKKEKKYFKEAKEWFDKAYKIEPDNVNLACAMGRYFLYVEDYSEAIKKLEYARGKRPEDENIKSSLARAYNGEAYLLYKAGRNLDYGIRLVNKAIKMAPDDGIILSTKAELLYKLGRYKEAYNYIKKSRKLAPDEKEIKQDFKMIKDALDRN